MVIDGTGSLSAEAENRPPAPKPSRFLARQPILNARREVAAYELLSRDGWENWFVGESEGATLRTVDHCLYMGIEALTNSKLAFVKCTRESIVNNVVTLLPPGITVIEIMQTTAPDEELVKACIDLRRMGYRLSLDDFMPRPEMQPMIEIADYVNVDFRLADAYTRRQIHRMMRYSGGALVAEKIEDQEQFNIARGEGYEYFQGYFFCRPQIIANREMPANRMNYLQLLIELTRKTVNLAEITRLVGLEPSLAYRLLRLANSALWARRGEITSIRDAFVFVGEDRFRSLVSVAASCLLSQEQTPALVSLSLERARFCELMAPLIGESPSEQFMLGLLSLLDAMLDVPMDTITDSLPLRKEAKAALRGATNQVAVPLCLIRSFEAGAWQVCTGTAAALDVREDTLARLYVESVQWATASLAASQPAPNGAMLGLTEGIARSA